MGTLQGRGGEAEDELGQALPTSTVRSAIDLLVLLSLSSDRLFSL